MGNSNGFAKYQNTGKSGVQFRNSFMATYDDGKTGFSLGTNLWSGAVGMKNSFDQRTGLIGVHSGDFKISYENDGVRQGLITDGLDHFAHEVSGRIEKKKTILVGIYGAGGKRAGDNPELKKIVEDQGGTMFTSTTPFGEGDSKIIKYLKAEFEKANDLKIYGYSRGAAAAVRIANKLGELNINILEINLYDPVSLYGGGGFIFNYPNVKKVNNYYQRNPIDGVLWWAGNPFKGSPVIANFHCPEINEINFTGQYNCDGQIISHINIIRHVQKLF